MSNITIKYNPVQSIGYVSCNVPSDVFAVVEQEVQDIIDSNFKDAEPYNNQLAGSIENEYALKKSAEILNNLFKQVIPEYWKLQGDLKNADICYQINTRRLGGGPDLWVNLQKKYEMNPLHDHGGVLSFVLYVKIPYDITEEESLPHTKNSKNIIGPAFSFVYPALPKFDKRFLPTDSHLIRVDKSWEGTMIIFPAWLQHMVYPFYTSDDYRISVSGNLIPQK